MLFPPVLLAQYAGTLEIQDTSRIDARSNQPYTLAPTPPPREVALASDASIAPMARLRLSDRQWDYVLTYSPTFTVTDVELISESQPVVLNAGMASIGWHDRFLRVVVSESASYGWEDLAYLYGTPVAGQTSGQSLGQTGGSAAIPLQVFPFGSSSTTASVTMHETRSVTVNVSGGYSLTGNLTNNPAATTIYPEQYGPSAAASVAYTMSRADSLLTLASAQEITTPVGVCVGGTAGQTCRQVAPILLVEETARHRLSPTANVSASLGVSGSIYPLATGEAWGILPVGGVAYTDRFGAAPHDPRDLLEPSGVRLSADLAPTINVFTGSPSNRVQLTASLVSRIAPDVSVSFLAGALQTISFPRPDPSPLTLVNGGIDLRFRVTRLISVSAGVQAFWENQQNVGVIPTAGATNGPTTLATEVGYVALTVRLPRLRL